MRPRVVASFALMLLAGCASPSAPVDGGPRADALRIDAPLPDASPGIDALPPDVAAPDVAPVRDAPCPYHPIVLAGSDDPVANTAAFQAALDAASAASAGGPMGPGGAPQGVVYVPPRVVPLYDLDVPSNVLVEIAPGATLVALTRATDVATPVDRAVFNFGLDRDGRASTRAQNVTIRAGDGCGGAGDATWANKLRDTAARGNDPVVPNAYGVPGMANVHDLGALPYWGPMIPGLWVMDTDARYNHTNPFAHGFRFAWAADVVIEDVFSIQNAERKVHPADDLGTIRASRRPVMNFQPPTGAPYPVAGADPVAPLRVHVHRHVNILSLSGYGPNQIRSCIDCEFSDVFSHGGTVLRVETDTNPPFSPAMACMAGRVDGDCSCVQPDGTGFATFMNVTGLTARNLEGQYGNAVVQLTPHCRIDGSVSVTNVRGTSMWQTVKIENGEPDPTHSGYFRTPPTIENVQTVGGTLAQHPLPTDNTYVLDAPQGAIGNAATRYDPVFSGTLCWPAAGTPGGLPDLTPASHPIHGPAITRTCAATWP